eukprot:14490776-Alexandrium_andersonii.AAC.1
MAPKRPPQVPSWDFAAGPPPGAPAAGRDRCVGPAPLTPAAGEAGPDPAPAVYPGSAASAARARILRPPQEGPPALRGPIAGSISPARPRLPTGVRPGMGRRRPG